MADILHKDLCYRIVKCCYAVRNKYGKHHKEVVFQRALHEEFDLEGLKYESQPRVDVYSVNTGRKIGVYIPDDLVENIVLVEIKALPFNSKDHEMQLCEYLKTSKYEVGYLINFGEECFRPKRFIYTNDRKSFLLYS